MSTKRWRWAALAPIATLVAAGVGGIASSPAYAGVDCNVPDPPPICEGPPDPTPSPAPVTRVRGDFDGDGKADLTVYRLEDNRWYTLGSKTGQPMAPVWFGRPEFERDDPAPGHFDSDARLDHGMLTAIVGPTQAFDHSTFSYRSSVTGQSVTGPDTFFNSRPAIADYTGDGRDERASVTSGMTWRVPGFPDRAWGMQGDRAVPADYDRDKKADLAVWRPSNGTWYVINSSTGAVTTRHWGQAGDVPVPGDYDGDGKADFAVWRPSNGAWHLIKSSTGAVSSFVWGIEGDNPVPLDYTGDKKTDLAVWRPSNGTWYVLPTGGGSGSVRAWGTYGDVPIR